MTTAEHPELSARWMRGGLPELVLRLRQAGFNAGASEALDASRLLRAVFKHDEPLDFTRAQAMLKPVFCKTRDQLAKFDDVFTKWRQDDVERPKLRWVAGDAAEPATAAPPSAPPATAARGTMLKQLAIGAVVLALAIGVGVALLRPRDTTTVPAGTPGTTQTTPRNTGSGTTARPASEDETVPLSFYPAFRQQQALRPVWAWVFLGALFLPAALLLLAPIREITASSRFLNERIPIRAWPKTKTFENVVQPLAGATHLRLSRHKSIEPGGLQDTAGMRRARIDVKRTVLATLKHHGVPTIVRRPAKIRPSYLVLACADEPSDYFALWAERFRIKTLDVEVALLRSTDDADAVPLVQRITPSAFTTDWTVALTRLPDPPPGQRLVVIGDARTFLSESGAPKPWFSRARLHRWPERSLFTPLEIRDWGIVEEALEKPLATNDRGFLVLPLDDAALEAWSYLLTRNTLPMFFLSSPERFPRLVQQSPSRLLEDDPGDLEVPELIRQLKLYLDENGFFWLCCCAVAPVIDSRLTLLLGEALFRRGLADERRLPVHIATSYPRLLMLPWIREKTMPTWLRIALVASIPESVRRRVRETVIALLDEQRRDPTADFYLGGDDGKKDGRRGRWLYVGFLDGRTPDDLALAMPRHWRKWLRELAVKKPLLRRIADRIRATALGLLRPRRAFGIPGGRLAAVALGVLAAVGSVFAFAVTAENQWLKDRLFETVSTSLALEHRERVTDAGFSPDGTRAVTASIDGQARIWDASTGALLAVLRGHQGPIQAAVFSADGARIATAGADNTARIWDAATGKSLTVLRGHTAQVNEVAFGPTGELVVTASNDGTARIWMAATGAEVGVLRAAREGMASARFSPDGTRIVTAGTQTQVWDVATREVLTTLRGRTQNYFDNSAAFSPDGTRIVTAAAGGTASVWDAEKGAPIATMSGHAEDLFDAQFSPDGTRIVTAAVDDARVWNAATGKELARVRNAHAQRQQFMRAASFSPDGARMVTACDDGKVQIWDSRPVAPIVERTYEGFSAIAAISSDGEHVLAVDDAGKGAILQAIDGKALTSLVGYVKKDAWAEFSPDGSRVVSPSNELNAVVWDAASGAALAVLSGHSDEVVSAAFSPDGERVVTTSSDATARVFDSTTGSQLAVLLGHEQHLYRAAFSRDGARIVTASADGTARVWDARTGTALRTLRANAEQINSAKFSPDGTRVVTAADDSTARLWNADTGAQLRAYDGHEGFVLEVQYSADGARLVTVDALGVRTWDEGTGQLLSQALADDSPVIQFRVDGTRVIGGGYTSARFRVWPAPPGPAPAAATTALTRAWDAVVSRTPIASAIALAGCLALAVLAATWIALRRRAVVRSAGELATAGQPVP